MEASGCPGLCVISEMTGVHDMPAANFPERLFRKNPLRRNRRIAQPAMVLLGDVLRYEQSALPARSVLAPLQTYLSGYRLPAHGFHLLPTTTGMR